MRIPVPGVRLRLVEKREPDRIYREGRESGFGVQGERLPPRRPRWIAKGGSGCENLYTQASRSSALQELAPHSLNPCQSARRQNPAAIQNGGDFAHRLEGSRPREPFFDGRMWHVLGFTHVASGHDQSLTQRPLGEPLAIALAELLCRPYISIMTSGGTFPRKLPHEAPKRVGNAMIRMDDA